MPTPILSEVKISVFGHSGANPAGIAHLFGALVASSTETECDLAIFTVNPADGIDQKTIDDWEALNDRLVPRLVLVTELDESESDFDDAVMLANRVFDKTVTPFLVLHDDDGAACALISMQDLSIIDYSVTPPQVIESDPDHKILVSEFQKEYLEEIEMMGENAFEAGLLFPAIPIWLDREIGVDIVRKYISRLAH